LLVGAAGVALLAACSGGGNSTTVSFSTFGPATASSTSSAGLSTLDDLTTLFHDKPGVALTVPFDGHDGAGNTLQGTVAFAIGAAKPVPTDSKPGRAGLFYIDAATVTLTNKSSTPVKLLRPPEIDIYFRDVGEPCFAPSAFGETTNACRPGEGFVISSQPGRAIDITMQPNQTVSMDTNSLASPLPAAGAYTQEEASLIADQINHGRVAGFEISIVTQDQQEQLDGLDVVVDNVGTIVKQCSPGPEDREPCGNTP
jgi:hypothetical protein